MQAVSLEKTLRPFVNVLALAQDQTPLAAAPADAGNSVTWGGPADFGTVADFNALAAQPPTFRVSAPPSRGIPAEDITYVFDSFHGNFNPDLSGFGFPVQMNFDNGPDLKRDAMRMLNTRVGQALEHAPSIRWNFNYRAD